VKSTKLKGKLGSIISSCKLARSIDRSLRIETNEDIVYKEVKVLLDMEEESKYQLMSGEQFGIFHEKVRTALIDWVLQNSGSIEGERKARTSIKGAQLHSFMHSSIPVWESLGNLLPSSERSVFRRMYEKDKHRDLYKRIKLMTIHGSKGKEADLIVLLNAGTSFEGDPTLLKEDEERRVFYVGVTRAKKKLVVLTIEGITETMFLPHEIQREMGVV